MKSREGQRGDRTVDPSCPPLAFFPWGPDISDTFRSRSPSSRRSRRCPRTAHASICPFATDGAVPGTAAAVPLGPRQAVPRAREGGQREERPHSRSAARRRHDPHDAAWPDPIVRKVTGASLTRARALSAPDAGAARVDREPDCDRAVSSEAGQEGKRTWHTYRHSER